MTEFKDERTGDRIEIKGRSGMVGVTTRFGDAELHTYFGAALWPAIAAEGLEAAGVEVPAYMPALKEAGSYEEHERHRLVGKALWCLQMDTAIREYHAKPRVTDEQVAAIRLEGNSYLTELQVRGVLEAAVDSGVLQVPADNKEGDR